MQFAIKIPVHLDEPLSLRGAQLSVNTNRSYTFAYAPIQSNGVKPTQPAHLEAHDAQTERVASKIAASSSEDKNQA